MLVMCGQTLKINRFFFGVVFFNPVQFRPCHFIHLIALKGLQPSAEVTQQRGNDSIKVLPKN